MWTLDENTLTLAKWLTGLLLGTAGAAKIWFRLRRDNRLDNAGEAAEDGYRIIVDQLQAHVARLDKAIADMGERLNKEMQLRYQAEAEAGALRQRVVDLEQEIRGMKLTRGLP